jgi:hypothetical protein
MARELVGRNGIGETADAVWKALNSEHQKLFQTNSKTNGDGSSTDHNDAMEVPFEPGSLVEATLDTSVIVAFGQRTDTLSGRRRRAKIPAPEQASLFSLN